MAMDTSFVTWQNIILTTVPPYPKLSSYILLLTNMSLRIIVSEKLGCFPELLLHVNILIHRLESCSIVAFFAPVDVECVSRFTRILRRMRCEKKGIFLAREGAVVFLELMPQHYKELLLGSW
jgi:hypothetical protein